MCPVRKETSSKLSFLSCRITTKMIKNLRTSLPLLSTNLILLNNIYKPFRTFKRSFINRKLFMKNIKTLFSERLQYIIYTNYFLLYRFISPNEGRISGF